jgi:ABC-type multidrug transport system fused ATPase/permease subunit
VVSDTYYGFVSIKALNGEKRRLKEFRKKSAQLLERSSETANWTALEQALTEILSFVSIGLVLFLSAKYHSVSYSNGMLLSVILVLLYMRGPLRRLLRLPSIYAKGQNALTKVCVLLSLPVELSSGDELCKKELLSIRFENLVLIEGHKPLSTVLPPGSLVQISGPHGSGKSRLLACLLQLDEPCAGSIYIGDENLAATPPFQTRRRIALVSDLLLPEGNTVAEFIRAEGTEQRRLAAREWYNHFCESFSLVQGSDTFESWCRTDVSALSDTHIRLLKVIRAFLSGKKIICIDGQFVHFSNEELEQLARFIEAMKGKRTFVIASQSLPPGLQPDFHIQLS